MLSSFLSQVRDLRVRLKTLQTHYRPIISSPDPTGFSASMLFILFTYISASPLPDDQDGVNFVLGTIRYDPLSHQPHFPGYPVYIILCKIAAFFSASPERGAVNLSIFFGAVSVYFIISILKTRFTPITAVMCGILLSLNPVFFEFSHKIFSEITALALLLLSITILKDPKRASGRRWFLSLFVMGLLAGVRLSWWPFPLIYLLAGLYFRRTGHVVAGSVSGVLIWFIPQTTQVGLSAFLQSGISFTYGHFTRWGGAFGSMPEKGSRIVMFSQRAEEASGVFAATSQWLTMPWLFLIISRMLIFFYKLKKHYVNRRPGTLIFNKKKAQDQYPQLCYHRQITLFFTALSAYLAWVFPGQNPEKVRHLIPLIPGLIIAAAPAVERFQKTAVLAILCMAVSLSLNYAQRSVNAGPYTQFREWVRNSALPNADFFCGPSERYFDLYPVKNRVVSVKSVSELQNRVKSTWPESANRFVCDDIPGFTTDKGAVRLFSARKGDPVDRTLKIYKLL